jgi:hypothetical protein
MPKNVLRNEQLRCLRDFPRERAALEYADHANGVLFGCRISANDAIRIEPGVILRGGVFYGMTEAFLLSFGPRDTVQYVNVRFTEDRVSKEYLVIRVAEIVLEESPAGEDGMELARFKLNEGARLRSDYVDFDDLDTEFDTLRLTGAPCAGRGGQTLLPFITEFFAKEALSYRPQNPTDVGFAFLCLQENRVHLSVLQSYLDTKTENLRELYIGLRKRLAVIKSGRSAPAPAERRIRKILVD